MSGLKGETLIKEGPTQPVFISKRLFIRRKREQPASESWPLQAERQLKLNCAVFAFKGKSMALIESNKPATYECITDLPAAKCGFEIKHTKKITVSGLQPHMMTGLPDMEAKKCSFY